MTASTVDSSITVHGKMLPGFEKVLTAEALAFIAALSGKFSPSVENLLAKRLVRQKDIDQGNLPDFLPETESVRSSAWKTAKVPADLQDRRVEITGPTSRKMVINALNSGAKVFMADFEDAHSPVWEETIQGQINMRDAVAGTISWQSPEGKEYRLNEKVATLIVRPRGWHLQEKHITHNGKPIYGAFCDFGLFLFHNHQILKAKNSGPYFYLPKLEHYTEARLWNEVFAFAEEYLGMAHGTIKATVLIETILAAFQMEEILFELKDYIIALNCGRWDYIFSFIKKFHAYPEWILPDRASVTMDKHFLKSYCTLLVHTCHKRGAYAMGGMAAQIPIKNDPAANEAAFAKVRADKEREVKLGHDGTWVAHPGLVPVAMEAFSKIEGVNQCSVLHEEAHITAADLLKLPEGEITEKGVRNNVSVSLHYIASWLSGNGCVPIFNLMEDAATAEISRSQLWQWLHSPKAVLADGRKFDKPLFLQILEEELAVIREDSGKEQFAASHYSDARKIVENLVLSTDFTEFLTLPASNYLP